MREPSTPPEKSSPTVVAPPRHGAPGTALRARLALGLCVGSGLLIAASLFGLVPLRAPTPVPPVPLDESRLVEQARVPEQAPDRPPAHRMLLWSFPVCEKPSEGARLFRIALREGREVFAVWCRGEYVVVDVSASEETPRLTRLGRFAARAERPGGATALDLDGDGLTDLVLAVAPPEGVIHRAFSGVYWLRGRAQGGYELARSLVEMPTVALAAAEIDEAPGNELIVLTRGDLAAQRPGELWLFTGGAAPTRGAVLATALGPSDLRVARSTPEASTLAVTATQPGAVIQIDLPRSRSTWAAATRHDLPLRGVQAFVSTAGAGHGLYVRDALHVQALRSEGAATSFEPYLRDAQVGPAVLLTGGAPAERRLLGTTAGGFALFRGQNRRDRTLPSGVQVLDAESVGGAAAAARGLLLIATADGQLALVVLPSELREEASEIELRSGSIEAAPSEARVALE